MVSYGSKLLRAWGGSRIICRFSPYCMGGAVGFPVVQTLDLCGACSSNSNNTGRLARNFVVVCVACSSTAAGSMLALHMCSGMTRGYISGVAGVLAGRVGFVTLREACLCWAWQGSATQQVAERTALCTVHILAVVLMYSAD